jgi:hypothetical protein
MLKLAGLIIIYYVPSIGLTFYQGWLIKELKFPITIVLTHFIMKVQTCICSKMLTMLPPSSAWPGPAGPATPSTQGWRGSL